MPGTARSQPLLDVQSLTVEFPDRAGCLRRSVPAIPAVRSVSFSIEAGRTLGLVGESGSGKTTLGRAVLGLLPAIARVCGRVRFDGQDVLGIRGAASRAMRRHVQIIFQDPGGSLSPRMRVRDIVGEPLLVHRVYRRSTDRLAEVDRLLERCGIPRRSAGRYPHEFSGGQKQRIAIARALSLKPSLIVCDEPTSALDVSVQAQILNLLKELQEEHRLSYLFISHDLPVVAFMCDDIAVLQRGRVVEHGPRDAILGSPVHEYTRSLLASSPTVPQLVTSAPAAPSQTLPTDPAVGPR